MILANVAAAESLERARVPLIYRVHDEPGLEKIVSLRGFPARPRHLTTEGGGAAAQAGLQCHPRSRAATTLH